MSAKHTPGPWTKTKSGLTGSDGELVVTWDAGIYFGARTPESEANSRLIAAAPELLEALEGMMKNHYEPHSQEWINAANAVSKARN